MVEVSEIKASLEGLGKLLAVAADMVPVLAGALPSQELGEEYSRRVEFLSDAKAERIDLGSLREGRFSSVASLDSSSRVVESPTASLVVVAGAAYSTLRGHLVYPLNVHGTYLGVASYLAVLREIEPAVASMTGIAVRNRAGYYYALDEVEVVTRQGAARGRLYEVNDAADELRLEAENALLAALYGEDLVVVDGPLVPTPAKLVMDPLDPRLAGLPAEVDKLGHYGRMTHAWALAYILWERVKLLRSARAVVGVVKRLSNSRKLSVAEGAEGVLGFKAYVPDDVAMEHFARRTCTSRLQLCLVGPLRISSSVRVERLDTRQEALAEGDIPDRYAYYVALRLSGAQAFYRLEALDVETLDESVAEVFSGVTSSVIPERVHVADLLAKKASTALFYLSYEVLSDLLALSYDTRVEASEAARRIAEKLETNTPPQGLTAYLSGIAS